MQLLAAFTKISKTAYLVAFITFLMRAGQFMSLPFLAIYLTREGLMTHSQIGLILGISGFVLSMTGFINGIFVDRSSYKKILITALFLVSVCYFCFAFSMHLFCGLLLINAALGWFRSLAEISAIVMIVKNTRPEYLSYAYSARFIGANLGVVLGPLIGAVMATHESLLIFFIAGAINIAIAIMLLFYREKPVSEGSPAQPKIKLRENFVLVLKDKTLINLTLMNLMLWMAYSQLDTTLPQYLAATWKNPAVLFSMLMAINAGICVVFQPFILRWAEMTSLKNSGIVGSVMFAVAFLLLGVFPSTPIMITSVVLMSFAELFTMPINGLLVMRASPQHLIASYNGFYSLGYLGLSLGPILGGIGLQYIGGHSVFLFSAILPLIVVWWYVKYVPD